MLRVDRYLTIIILFFFAVSTGGCCGGGGSSSGGSGNNNPVSSTPITIPTMTTDATGNAKARVTGSTQISVTVNSLSAGKTGPVSGLQVDITTDQTNYYILLTDPTGAVPPIPIAFNVNDVSSNASKSLAGRALIKTKNNAASCSIQAMENVLNYVVSIVGGEIEVVANILDAQDILSAIASAPAAIKSTASFHPFQDISHGGLYLCRCTLNEAVNDLQAKVDLASGVITLSTLDLPTVGEIAGVLVSTADLFTQMQSVVYCLYGYDDNYIFDWSWTNGVLTPVPVGPSPSPKPTPPPADNGSAIINW